MAHPASQPSIDTCNACGKLFPRVSMRLCTGCSMVEEHRFALVREYIQDHDGSNIIEIARGTGVSGSDVRRFMEGGRLIEIGGGAVCTCGGTGTRCKYCRSHLSSKLKDLEETMAREHTERAPTRNRSTSGGGTGFVHRIRRTAGDE